jgi:hypothetical protein
MTLISSMATLGPASVAGDPTRLLLSRGERPSQPQESARPTYCVQGDTLRFGAEAEPYLPAVNAVTFRRVNCAESNPGP